MRRWNRDNAQDILPFTDIDLKNLNLDCILTRSLKVHHFYTQLHKTKSLASSPLGIHLTILKNLPPKIYIYITRLYNATSDTGYFPKIFNHACIHLIPKPNNTHTDPKN